MGIFASILAKLGIGGTAASTRHRPANVGPAARTPGGRGVAPAPRPAVAIAASKPIPVADLLARIEAKAGASGQKLEWKTSIVDLLKLLGLDSSLAARKELATELNAPTDVMDDSAEMNVWLHREVIARIAANGGNIPTTLLD